MCIASVICFDSYRIWWSWFPKFKIVGVAHSCIYAVFTAIANQGCLITSGDLLLLPWALQPTVGFGLSNNILPFSPVYHQLSPSSNSQHLKISLYFLFPSFPGSSPSTRPFQFLGEDLFGHPILLHSLQVTFMFHSPSVDKITNLFRKTGLKIAFRPTNTIFQQLTQKPKPKNNNPSRMFQLKCNSCNRAYVGQSDKQ